MVLTPLIRLNEGRPLQQKNREKTHTFFAELALFELKNEAQLRITKTRAIPNLGVFQFRRSEQGARTLVDMAHPKRARLVLKKKMFAFRSCGGFKWFFGKSEQNSFF